MKSPLARKRDFIIILLILAPVLLFYIQYPKSTAAVAVIELNGKLYAEIPLASTDKTIKVNGAILELTNNKIRFASSECRDKICCRFGYLNKPGQAAACVPARVSVRISGKAVIDGVTG